VDIPSDEDWEGYRGDPEAEWAHGIFAGKSNDQVQADFERTVLERSFELSYMPDRPFRYYIFGFKQYLEKRAAFPEIDSSDAASSFLQLIDQTLVEKPERIRPVIGDLMPCVRFVANNQALYNADEDIYGSFKELLASIEAHLQQHGMRD
jgi:hypothetical protein